MRNIYLTILFVIITISCDNETKINTYSTNIELSNIIERVEPPNWWVEMDTKNLQLLIYGDNISNLEPRINSSSINLNSVERVENNNYLFLNITINQNAKNEIIEINFYDNGNLVDNMIFLY